MAKILPFVVEKSTPMHIFQTLVQRGKGLNHVLMASVFYAILSEGIAKIRDITLTIPEGTSTNEIYQAILTKLPKYSVSSDSFFNRLKNVIQNIDNTHPHLLPEELKEYDTIDKTIFLAGVTLADIDKDYTNLDLMRIADIEPIEHALNNLPQGEHPMFSSTAELVTVFNSKAELIDYIITYLVILPYTPYVPVKAILKPRKKGKKKNSYSIPDETEAEGDWTKEDESET